MAQILSRTIFQRRHQQGDGGLSAYTEDVRTLEDSGAESRYLIETQFTDARGEPTNATEPLYRMKSTGEYRSPTSCFQCNGCHFFHPLEEGKEIVMPEDEIRQLYKEGSLNHQDLIPAVSTYLASQHRPRKGFCPECFKKERRKRILSAVRSVIAMPIKALFSSSEEPPPPRPPIVFYPLRSDNELGPAFRDQATNHTREDDPRQNRRGH